VELLATKGIVPGLVVISVGVDEASIVYMKSKERSCEKLGINYTGCHLSEETTQKQLLEQIDKFAGDEAVSGMIVQLPIPQGLNVQEVQERIPWYKDVDGLSPRNLGALLQGGEGFLPCTPAGVMDMLDHYQIPLEGKNAVVIGRSAIVGKPMAHLLLNRNATVTICHSRTKDLASIVRKADIVVAALGKPGFVRGEMIAPGAVVIDVGINQTEEGLVGDVAFAEMDHAAFITPVPGGVGPLTVARLMANTVLAAKRKKYSS
jgi:methylenetetrahydrofolate dehydrogenase (NADP+)/methenyltetrahydrofolate cyclohydrolase